MNDSKNRSPKFPAIDLKTAIETVEAVFEEETFNKMSREVLVGHLGYSGLSGASTTKLGALRHFGLIEGSGDELKVSEEASTLLMGERDSDEYQYVLQSLALKPQLFKDLLDEFKTPPSQKNLEFTLVKRGFLKSSAGKAAEVFLRTVDFAGLWNSPPISEDHAIQSSAEATSPETKVAKGTKTRIIDRKFFGGGSINPPVDHGREIAAGMLSTSTTFKLFVQGPITEKEFDILMKKLEIDREIITSSEDFDE